MRRGFAEWLYASPLRPVRSQPVSGSNPDSHHWLVLPHSPNLTAWATTGSREIPEADTAQPYLRLLPMGNR